MRVFEPRRMRLQTRVLIRFVSLLVCTVALVVFVVDSRKGQMLLNLNEERGLAVARSIAAAAASEMLSYNYISLQHLADRVVEEEGVGYVIILDKEGHVAGYSGRPDWQGKQLHDLVSAAAHDSRRPLVQEIESPFLGLDIAVPVYAEGSPQKWGTVRVGLSLQPVYAEMRQTRLAILGLGIFVLAVAFVVARELSRRITVPLGRLVLATDELSRGNFEHRVGLSTGDEIEHLADRFNQMAEDVRLKQEEIEAKNRELAALNATLEVKVQERTRALRETEEKYRILVEFSPDPICIFQEGRLVFFNNAFRSTFGYEEEELQDGDFDPLRLVHPANHDAFRRHLAGPGEGDAAAPAEIVGLHRDGSEIYLDVRSTEIRYSGRPALETIMIDVTSQRLLQEKVVSYERLSALGEMASGVAHDFNNILGTILARAQYLRRKTGDEEIQRGLRIIETAAEDGGATVRRIQEFSRVRTDRDFTAIDVRSILDDVIEMTRTRWEDQAHRQGRSIRVSSEAPAGLHVLGSVHELREVFMNLLLNAADAIAETGTITLGATADEEMVTVSVEDTGEGMSTEIQRKLFDPFFSTKGVKGTGLGMSIVYGIITRHGGDITVESEPGRGTVFRVELPRAVGSGTPPAPPAETSVLRGEGRVLVVDDEEAIRNLAAEILSDVGYTVEEAPGGAEAIARLREESFDLVITDLGMPEVSGWDVARACGELRPRAGVLLLTGWGAALDPEEVREHGIDRVLQKPFHMEALLETARELLESAAGLADARRAA